MTQPPTLEPKLSLQTIEANEYCSRLSKLEPHKSTVLDGIPSAVLDYQLHSCLSLCSIINSSIATGFFPTIWKSAVVKPLHKGGQRLSFVGHLTLLVNLLSAQS